MSKKKKILIVDDTPSNIDILLEILKDKYDILVAIDGERALNLLNRELPDLILLDIMMPRIDGYETSRRIKANPRTSDIPILFLSTKSDIGDIVKGFEDGAVDYITKPFIPTELLIRIKTHLLIKQQKDDIAMKNRENQELLHVLSHDLANHFSVMRLSLEAHRILDHYTVEELVSNFEMATKNGTDIISLVKEMSAMEAGKIEMEQINLFDTIEKSYTILKKKFSDKNIKLLNIVDEKINVIAERRSFLNSVINNIFTNAIKFSYENSEIITSATKVDDLTTLIIQDHGMGMPQELVNNIFDVTAKTSRIGTKKEVGTGFGMPLVKKFVNLYGGEIIIKSKDKKKYPYDHGTQVILTLKT